MIKVRDRLVSAAISSLLMISINAPLLANFNARKYVISCLKKERHGAEDKATGLKCHTGAISESSKLLILAPSQKFMRLCFICQVN